MEFVGPILIAILFVAFLVFAIPWLMQLKKGYLEIALGEYSAQNGVKLQLVKCGIPPLRYWLSNRKGDCWGLVEFEDGTQKWVRYGTRLMGKPLKFYG